MVAHWSNHIMGDAERVTLRTEELFEALRRRILTEEWPAGSRLPSERELAELYQTNRNTLREALRRLEQARLVTVRHGQGVTVADFRRTGSLELLGPFLVHGRDPREKAQLILDFLGPRLRVIEIGIEQLVLRALPTDLPPLEDVLRMAREAQITLDPHRHLAVERAWFAAMAEASHNLAISWIANPMIAGMTDVMHRWPELIVFEPSFAQYASELLSAVSARDVDRALTLTRQYYGAIDASVRAMLEPLVRSMAPAASEAAEETAASSNGVPA